MTDLKDIHSKVGFIGAGNMARALISGLVKKGLAPTQLFVTDLEKDKVMALEDELGVRGMKDAAAVQNAADVVVLAVKPATVVPLLKSLADETSVTLWLSIAAGIDTATMEQALGAGSRVVRAMPNTPCLVSEGATGLTSGKDATSKDIELAETLMGAVGMTAVVDEKMMDALTGVSGSGPAYVMLVIEAMADGAVRAGLPRPIALSLAAQTVRGAATLQLETGKHPGVLKDMVTSPGGTTIAGVEALEKAGLRAAFIRAVTAAAAQSARLAGN